MSLPSDAPNTTLGFLHFVTRTDGTSFLHYHRDHMDCTSCPVESRLYGPENINSTDYKSLYRFTNCFARTNYNSPVTSQMCVWMFSFFWFQHGGSLFFATLWRLKGGQKPRTQSIAITIKMSVRFLSLVDPVTQARIKLRKNRLPFCFGSFDMKRELKIHYALAHCSQSRLTNICP